jgi:hypothetical protein
MSVGYQYIRAIQKIRTAPGSIYIEHTPRVIDDSSAVNNPGRSYAPLLEAIHRLPGYAALQGLSELGLPSPIVRQGGLSCYDRHHQGCSHGG